MAKNNGMDFTHKGDSWAEVKRLQRMAFGGRDNVLLKTYGLEDTSAWRKAAAMANRLVKTQSANQGTPNDPEW